LAATGAAATVAAIKLIPNRSKNAAVVDHRTGPDKPARRGTPSRRRSRVARASGRHYAVASNGTRKMPIRLKKLIGTVLLVALVVVYALIATIVAVAQLSQSGPLTHLMFFLFSGLLWILPAMGIIKWMILEPRPKR
jgi:hypothetical protein